MSERAQQAERLLEMAKEQREYAESYRSLDGDVLNDKGKAEVERHASEFDVEADALEAGAAALLQQEQIAEQVDRILMETDAPASEPQPDGWFRAISAARDRVHALWQKET